MRYSFRGKNLRFGIYVVLDEKFMQIYEEKGAGQEQIIFSRKITDEEEIAYLKFNTNLEHMTATIFDDLKIQQCSLLYNIIAFWNSMNDQ